MQFPKGSTRFCFNYSALFKQLKRFPLPFDCSRSVSFFSLLLIILIISTIQESYGIEKKDLKEAPYTPWHISADEVIYDNDNSSYQAIGNVVIEKLERKITADRVHFDRKSLQAIAEGNVVMVVGHDKIWGEKIDLNLKSETGTIYNGKVFLSRNHFYIGGEKIEKIGEESYRAKKAYVTPCDGELPDWKLSSRNLNVTIEGYGVATHVAFWIQNAPLFYTPFLVFPAKTKRQSGLLAPEISFPDRKGNAYHQPFFWAINDSMDATFYYHHLSKRGDKGGLEFRYVLSDQSKGIFMADGLKDLRIDDGLPENSTKWGYTHDTYLRPNSDRYWLRAKQDLALPFGITSKLDIDIVSDQDYLREFNSGMTGFKESEAIYLKRFGRDLDDTNVTTRKNQFLLTKNFSNININSGVIFYDDVIRRRFEKTDPTLQKLPFLQLNASKKRFLKTPFYYSVSSESNRFFRREGRYENDITSAYRGDFHPRIYLPITMKSIFSFEPSVGYRKTKWAIDTTEKGSSSNTGSMNTYYDREIHDVRLDLSSSFFKIFHPEFKILKRVKHTVQPHISYEFTPEKDQSMYPLFDGVDRIAQKDLLTYALTQTFTSRYSLLSKEKESMPLYNRFLRLRVEQSFDLNELKEDMIKDKRPYKDLKGELDFTPINILSFDADASWNVYDSEFISADLGIFLWDRYGNNLKTEYRYKRNSSDTARDGSESLYTEGRITLSDRLSFMGHFERSLYDDETLKTGYGFQYQAKCWMIDVQYLNENDDSQYRFMLKLNGLGHIGE